MPFNICGQSVMLNDAYHWLILAEPNLAYLELVPSKAVPNTRLLNRELKNALVPVLAEDSLMTEVCWISFLQGLSFRGQGFCKSSLRAVTLTLNIFCSGFSIIASIFVSFILPICLAAYITLGHQNCHPHPSLLVLEWVRMANGWLAPWLLSLCTWLSFEPIQISWEELLRRCTS